MLASEHIVNDKGFKLGEGNTFIYFETLSVTQFISVNNGGYRNFKKYYILYLYPLHINIYFFKGFLTKDGDNL